MVLKADKILDDPIEIGRTKDFEIPVFQMLGYSLTNCVIILDDQNTIHGRLLSSCAAQAVQTPPQGAGFGCEAAKSPETCRQCRRQRAGP